MKNIKELLTTAVGTEGSLLVEKTIYGTLWEAVEKKMLSRSLAALVIGPTGINGSSVDINLVTPDSMRVFKVAEGARIPLDSCAYTESNLKPIKYGVKLGVTTEMQEDGKWDLIAQNIRTAGREMAENETALILTALDGATNVVTGGAAITIANLTRGMQYLEDEDYEATDLIVGAEVANDLRNIDTFTETNKFGSNEMLKTGMIGTIFGMNVWRFSSKLGTSTRAYIIDRNQAFAIAEKRPITVEGFKDITCDLSESTVTQRLKVGLLRDYAAVRITTT